MAVIFNSCEFVFAGESSLMYGLQVYDLDNHQQEDVPFGNKASIIETRTPRRIQPLHFGVNYNAEPLSFKLVFGAEQPLDRYDLEAISLWLTGHQQYQWLFLCQDDLEGVSYRCLITELRPISLWWLPVAFEATIVCDCPYAYSEPWTWSTTMSNASQKTVTFSNESTVREYLCPVLTFTPNGASSLEIINVTDNNRTFKVTGLTNNVVVYADCANGILMDTGVNHLNLYDGFSPMNFPRFVCGDNTLKITGKGSLTITGRFLRNVAG